MKVLMHSEIFCTTWSITALWDKLYETLHCTYHKVENDWPEQQWMCWNNFAETRTDSSPPCKLQQLMSQQVLCVVLSNASCLPLAFWQVAPTLFQYPFISLGWARHWENEVPNPKTQNSDPTQGWNTDMLILSLHHVLTSHKFKQTCIKFIGDYFTSSSPNWSTFSVMPLAKGK